MGFPHATVTVPGWWPDILSEVIPLAEQPLGAELLDGLRGGTATPGHVCATAFVLSPDHGRVLLVHHHRLGWSNPGGHVEPAETTADAALRELAEETGLGPDDLIALGPVAVHVTDVPATARDPAHRHWNVAWAFVASPDAPLTAETIVASPGTATPGEPTTAELCWFPVDALPTDDAAADLSPTWRVVQHALARRQS